MALVAVMDLALRASPNQALPGGLKRELWRIYAPDYAPLSQLYKGSDERVGDLVALANLKSDPFPLIQPVQADEFGFRNEAYAFREHRADALLIGSSFSAVGGDEDLLSRRLSERSGLRFYNAGTFVPDAYRTDEKLWIADRFLQPGGLVVIEYLERATIPPDPRPRLRRDPCGLLEPATEIERACLIARAHVSSSPLQTGIRSLVKRLQNDSALPNPYRGEVKERHYVDGTKVLFLSSEVRLYDEGMHREQQTVNALAEMDRLFRERGFSVLVVLNPSKYRVLRPLLRGENRRSGGADSYLGDIAGSLRERGVATIDLTSALQSGAANALETGVHTYWWDDTHWNPLGVDQAAEEIVRAMRLLPHDQF